QGPQRTSFFVLYAPTPHGDLVAAARAELRTVDAALPLYDERTMEDRLASSLAQRRVSTALLLAFATVALALAAVGIYAILARGGRGRRREIGIRMALGARSGAILRLVVGQGMELVAAGLILGLLGAAAATRLLEGLLFEVRPMDPLVLAAATLSLAAAGGLA